MHETVMNDGGGETNGNFAFRFHWFPKIFERDFLLKISHIAGKEWAIKVEQVIEPFMPMLQLG